MTEIPLLACPFCGGPASFERDGILWSISCSDATSTQDCPGYATNSAWPTKREAAIAWNRRVPVEQPPVLPSGIARGILYDQWLAFLLRSGIDEGEASRIASEVRDALVGRATEPLLGEEEE